MTPTSIAVELLRPSHRDSKAKSICRPALPQHRGFFAQFTLGLPSLVR